MGAEIDLSKTASARLDALVFGETQGRIVISVAGIDAVKILQRAKLLGAAAVILGTVGGSALKIKTTTADLMWELREIHDLWWNSIARAMQ